ncbi:SGNH/GDSL hydrolase family protein [Nocardia sp. NEAU-G5]|uniref:SGNH/GDSL hydrolase family protein n=1 Tax=Nocardia albiluteola TaxID=2842303 RepID=A0ABS6BAD2_9NOCA|nr:SGNH/GDSL hydrolase family protein [Nocardia albiluteola]MBU3066386.1 SGNH/GDSL hydrolase family protein [Nocardia albiluteola]
MRFARCAAVVALTAGLSALAGGTVSAHTETQHSSYRYVALGSSYASGPGIAPQIDTRCARSAADYPHLLAQRIGATLTDVTCAGATTTNILTRGQHTRSGVTVPPQIDAVTADTTLVTVSVGGNDLNLIGGMIGRSCHSALIAAAPTAAATTSRMCAVFGSAAAPTAAKVTAVEHALSDVVRAVRVRAPQATVLLVQYLPAIDGRAATCPGVVVMSPADAATMRRTYNSLISATRAAAAATGAMSIAVPDAEQHTACSATPWVNGFHNPLATGNIASITSSYHPNLAGMQAIADRLADMLPEY